MPSGSEGRAPSGVFVPQEGDWIADSNGDVWRCNHLMTWDCLGESPDQDSRGWTLAQVRAASDGPVYRVARVGIPL